MSFLRGYSIFSLGLSKYFFSRRRNTIILLILGIPVLLSLLLILSGNTFFSSFRFMDQIVSFGFGFYNVYAIMIILFFATYITTDEISDKTISYFVHSPISREEVFFWKFLCFITYSTLIYVFMETIFFITFSLPNLTLVSSNPEIIDLFFDILLITVINIVYFGSFFFFISVVTNKPVIWGLVIGFSDQILLGTLFPDLLGAYSLSYHIKAIAYDLLGGDIGVSFNPFMRVQDSYLVVIGLIIVFVGATLYLVKKRELK